MRKKEIRLESETDGRKEVMKVVRVSYFFVNRSRLVGDTAGSSDNNKLLLGSTRFRRRGFRNGRRWFVKGLRKLSEIESLHSLPILFHSLPATLFIRCCHHFDFTRLKLLTFRFCVLSQYSLLRAETKWRCFARRPLRFL